MKDVVTKFRTFRNWSLGLVLFSLMGSAYGKSPDSDRDAVKADIAAAAGEFQVPRQLLESVAFIESHWTHRIPKPPESIHQAPPSYGVMGLRNDDWFGHSLERSASLIGQSQEQLILDSHANIRGAAAYLRQLALDENVNGGHLVLDATTSNSTYLIPWVGVLMKYCGIPDQADARIYAAEVLKIAARGHHRDGISIEGTGELLISPAVVSSWSVAPSDSFPGVHWDPSPNFTSARRNPSYIVIHVTEGHYAGALSWLKMRRSKVSAHYVIRSSDGEISQLVSDQEVAWHARCWNSLAIGIEHEGFTDTGDGLSDALYGSSAKLVTFLAEKYGIPMDADHIIGHNFWETPAFKQQHILQDCNDHHDPGPFWDWAGYFSLIGNSIQR